MGGASSFLYPKILYVNLLGHGAKQIFAEIYPILLSVESESASRSTQDWGFWRSFLKIALFAPRVCPCKNFLWRP